jgi:lambda family phage portal protein
MAKKITLVRQPDGGLIPRVPGDRVNPLRKRGFGMAEQGRLFSDWQGQIENVQDSIRNGWITMTRRAIDLAESDPMCVRFIRFMVTNILGPHGIAVVPTPHDAQGRLDKTDAQTLRKAWVTWGKRETCAKNRCETWREHEEIALKYFLKYGEFIRRFVPDPGNPYGLAVHHMDPMLLDPTLNRPRIGTQNEIRNGVEIDEWGAPIAYWFNQVVNGQALMNGHERIEAQWINHYFIRERPGQTRGVTWFAPIGMRKKMLDGYEMAAVVAARLAASKMGFFQRVGEFGTDWVAGAEELPPEDVAPGVFEVLPDGYEFKDFNPSWPGADYDDFNKSVKRSIAAGLNVSYNTLSMDLEGVSWSGLRSGELADHDFCRTFQHSWSMGSQDIVYGKWLRFTLDFGNTGLPPYKYEKYREVKHRPRGWAWVDPKKQQEANQIGLRNGTLLISHIIEEDLGMSTEEYLEAVESERETLGDYHPLQWLIDKPSEVAPQTTPDPADPE